MATYSYYTQGRIRLAKHMKAVSKRTTTDIPSTNVCTVHGWVMWLMLHSALSDRPIMGAFSLPAYLALIGKRPTAGLARHNALRK